LLIGLLETYQIKRQLGKPRNRWYDNIKMELAEIRLESIDSISLAVVWDMWLSTMKAAMKLSCPQSETKFLTI
jgi:hypothetical protein